MVIVGVATTMKFQLFYKLAMEILFELFTLGFMTGSYSHTSLLIKLLSVEAVLKLGKQNA